MVVVALLSTVEEASLLSVVDDDASSDTVVDEETCSDIVVEEATVDDSVVEDVATTVDDSITVEEEMASLD